jgi:5-methyltetrahydrofolate--homocysteine methyltransferase
LTQQALEQDVSAEEILNKGLVAGMEVVGVQFKNNEIFIPEVLVAAKAMKSGMEIIRPLLIQDNVASKGKVVVGTVKGDLHDIGKNIVAMLLEGAGYEVIDLGADVSKEKFLEFTQNNSADIVGMSALLTTTMIYMKEIIDFMEDANLGRKIKYIVGGAPLTQAFADSIRADGYAPDAASAVDLVDGLMQK